MVQGHCKHLSLLGFFPSLEVNVLGQVLWFPGIPEPFARSPSSEAPGWVWCGALQWGTGVARWHFLQKLLDYEVDSDEEWEEEEPGESLSHSEEVRILHAEKFGTQLPLAV